LCSRGPLFGYCYKHREHKVEILIAATAIAHGFAQPLMLDSLLGTYKLVFNCSAITKQSAQQIVGAFDLYCVVQRRVSLSHQTLAINRLVRHTSGFANPHAMQPTLQISAVVLY
jgi:hypothetical protein